MRYEQQFNSLLNESKKFRKLATAKLGNVKPLLKEQYESQTGESLRWEIDDDKVTYYPNVTTVESRKDRKGNIMQGTKPGLQGKFKEGDGLLYFNRDYRPNGIQLNYELDYSNPIEIKTNDFIVGKFTKGGLISGKLFKSLQAGIFGEPAWDFENPITLTLTSGLADPEN